MTSPWLVFPMNFFCVLSGIMSAHASVANQLVERIDIDVRDQFDILWHFIRYRTHGKT